MGKGKRQNTIKKSPEISGGLFFELSHYLIIHQSYN